eukprot:m.142665 g.142665  ORF g.142665 m.142665 type:complete len:103 (+) comp14975_c0_seq2:66-374(+)
MDHHTINPVAAAKNMAIISQSRTLASILFGCAAGILGLTSLKGFAFYAIFSAIFSGLLFVVVGPKSSQFFASMRSVVWDGITDGMLTFVLFWTLLYAMVHLF